VQRTKPVAAEGLANKVGGLVNAWRKLICSKPMGRKLEAVFKETLVYVHSSMGKFNKSASVSPSVV
jgi:hypothetical protein